MTVLVGAPLFPEPTTPRTRWLGRVEPAVHWYTEVTRDEAIVGRSNINAWYPEFDDPEENLAARVRSEANVDHSGRPRWISSRDDAVDLSELIPD